MGYLSLIIALIKTAGQNTSGMSQNQYLDLLLGNYASVSGVMFWIVLAVWIVGALVVGFVLLRGDGITGLALGCQAVFVAVLPILQYILWRMAINMSNAYSAEGIVDQGKFWTGLIVSFLLGAG